jgi:hypothetical protein
MTNKHAIVTLALGAPFRKLWREHCSSNWAHYAKRHGYDVICIEEPLDASERARRRSPAWQKLLVLDQPFATRYERVVWIDADVLVNPAAPSIVDGVPLERVGAVDEYACPTRERFAQVLAKLYRYWEMTGSGFIRNETAADFYSAYKLPAHFDAVVQAGVLVLSPQHHGELLLRVYHDYDYQGRGGVWNLEMRPLSYELLNADRVTWLDPRFNYPWDQYKALHFPFLLNRPDHPRVAETARAALNDVHFLHFCGGAEDLQLVSGEPLQELGDHSALRTVRHHKPERHLQAPVVLFAPEQAESTRQVLEAIRQARPRRLLVVGVDVASTGALVGDVDWDCVVQSHHCTRGIEAGLDWAFSVVDAAIVLEHDCVPDPTFFRFCEELLAHHRDDPRVMTISGEELSSELDPPADRYRYTRYPLTWGWATWRRAWARHDPAMARWPALRDTGWLSQLLPDRHATTYWTGRFDKAYQSAERWTDAWTFSCWLLNGLCAAPRVNLVANTGFGWDAPPSAESMFAGMTTRPAQFPLAGPADVARDAEYDSFLEDVLYSGTVTRLLRRIRAQHARRKTPRPLGAHQP